LHLHCPGCFAFSAEDICNHRFSDHNYYAICQVIDVTFTRVIAPNNALANAFHTDTFDCSFCPGRKASVRSSLLDFFAIRRSMFNSDIQTSIICCNSALLPLRPIPEYFLVDCSRHRWTRSWKCLDGNATKGDSFGYDSSCARIRAAIVKRTSSKHTRKAYFYLAGSRYFTLALVKSRAIGIAIANSHNASRVILSN